MYRFLVLLVFVLGCNPTPMIPNHERYSPPEEPRLSLDPQQTGRIAGQVRWRGDKPKVPPFRYPHFSIGGFSWQERLNPLAPRIGSDSGVSEAVIWLQGSNIRTTKPWPHGPVRVQLRELQIQIDQDGASNHLTGIVRRGDEVEMVSRDAVPHSVRARGANVFTLQFPEPDRPLRRSFEEPGLIELSSASNHFFARAFLFVADHSYITRSDADGRFELTDVPPGEYDLVCWLPNYQVAKQERDPETSVTARQWYRPPVEMTRRIVVSPQRTIEVPFTVTESHFVAPNP